MFLAARLGVRTVQIGLLVDGLGALVLLWTGYISSRTDPSSRARRGYAMMVAALLFGIGFLLQFLGFHFR